MVIDAQKNEGGRARRSLTGVVVSSKMKDTVVVAVSRHVRHPRYGKYVRRTRRYKAHDPGNSKKEGERVTIEECRPISKDKHYKIAATGNKQQTANN